LREIFLQDLRSLHKVTGPWDLLIFTGDLVFSGGDAEYESFNRELGDVFSCIKDLGSDPQLVAVPGNHDIQRPAPNTMGLTELLSWSSTESVRNSFWKKDPPGYWEISRSSLEGYAKWHSSNPFRRPEITTTGLLPGDFSLTVERAGVRVGIVGLNSSFLHLAKGDMKGRLALELNQFHSACGGDGARWCSTHDIRILLTHHPMDWLSEAAQRTYKAEIAPSGRFHLHLYGHMHEPAIESASQGGSPYRRNCQGASLFGLEKWGDKEERRHGYSAMVLEKKDRSVELRMWPRVSAMRQSGDRHIVQDPGFTLTDDGGTKAEFIADLSRGTDPRGPSRKRPEARTEGRSSPATADPARSPRPTTTRFKVLLISTDRDLAETRNWVAQYLEQALGVEVSQGSAENAPDPSAFNLSVLIQGWWWDRGFAAKAWERAAVEKRSAFFSDESSDWPPRRLTEKNAEEAIREFRASVSGPFVFQDPKQLPEKIGGAVVQAIESQADSASADDRAPRPWERSYLAFRLPAWKAGRTSAGKPYLVDPEGATELYGPNLYVSLDGVSDRWMADRSGDVKLVRTYEIGKDMTIHGEGSSRLPLGRWLSETGLPRIALVGAPGGGKTVFLTRVAATLGNACLGRGLDLERSLRIDALRRDGGPLPIPVVLEATRIAENISKGLDAIPSCVLDEISQAPVETPGINEVRQGLESGRYMLLVDALDEIADNDRRLRVLDALKGMSLHERYSRARVVITTRSARYTGGLAFGPEFEVIEVAPMSSSQARDFCGRWSASKVRDDRYLIELRNAIIDLGQRTEQASDEQSISGNPLMLTAICMIYERYRSLPDDRARLCSLLVDDLCRSRRSEDPVHNWRLDDAGKRDLLQRIALEMQMEGAQTWPESKAREIALRGLPANETQKELRAARYVQWVADHTGLLRFQQPEHGQEEVRFWHRMFREYLAASRLSQQDGKVTELLEGLWADGRLTDPFWEDVFRMLPRALGTREKAEAVLGRLREIATREPEARARLLGLAVAGLVESRELFPNVDVKSLGGEIGATFEREWHLWPERDRLLLLDGLGRLSPSDGDPRITSERWMEVSGGEYTVGKKVRNVQRLPKDQPALNPAGRPVRVSPYRICWAPVTVQEYNDFAGAVDRYAEQFWTHSQGRKKKGRVTIADRHPEAWSRQLRHPNYPVTEVSWYEAVAYCKWRTARRSDGLVIRLPTEAQWEVATNIVIDGDTTPCNSEYLKSFRTSLEQGHAYIERPRPVGTNMCRIANCNVDILRRMFAWCDGFYEEPYGSRASTRILSSGYSKMTFLLRQVGFRLGPSGALEFSVPPYTVFSCVAEPGPSLPDPPGVEKQGHSSGVQHDAPSSDLEARTFRSTARRSKRGARERTPD
jgi:hypothetical protein